MQIRKPFIFIASLILMSLYLRGQNDSKPSGLDPNQSIKDYRLKEWSHIANYPDESRGQRLWNEKYAKPDGHHFGSIRN